MEENKEPGYEATDLDDEKTYKRLRTLLDSVETMTLHYYLQGQTTQEREEAFEYIKSNLMPYLEEVRVNRIRRPGDCPVGYYYCDGCCVPYPC